MIIAVKKENTEKTEENRKERFCALCGKIFWSGVVWALWFNFFTKNKKLTGSTKKSKELNIL